MRQNKYFFMADAGVGSASHHLRQAMFRPDFPEGMKGEANALLRRISRLAEDMGVQGDRLRGRTATEGFDTDLRWAKLGMENAVRYLLEAAKDKSATPFDVAQYRELARVADRLRSELDELVESVGEYSSTWAYLESAGQAASRAFDWLTQPSFARVASKYLKASTHAEAGRPQDSIDHE